MRRIRSSLLTSLRSLDSREFCVDTVPSTCASGGSSRYRHVYSRHRLTPSSRDSPVMFSQAFIRATALTELLLVSLFPFSFHFAAPFLQILKTSPDCLYTLIPYTQNCTLG